MRECSRIHFLANVHDRASESTICEFLSHSMHVTLTEHMCRCVILLGRDALFQGRWSRGSPMRKTTPGGVPPGSREEAHKTVVFLDMLVGYQLLMSYVLAHI